MAIRDRALPTEIFDRVESFRPIPGSAYILGTSPEQRSAHSAEWESSTSGVTFLRIESQGTDVIVVDTGTAEINVALRSEDQISKFLRLGGANIYIDITALAHHVWAPLIKVAMGMGVRLIVVYVEPADYRFSRTPTEGEIFDLSDRISGIAPIPGFLSLSEEREDDFCFIPLLGFEGVRLAYLLEQIQPPGGKIYPIVGLPGFRPEYPFHTYHGNRPPLKQSQCWKDVRYATANCPFSVFYAIEDIATLLPNDSLKIAPIGTKPHSLGAVLYALSAKRDVELVYDHPIRKSGRTGGVGRLLAYHISDFEG